MGKSTSRRGGYTKHSGSTAKTSVSKGNIVNAMGTHANKSDNAHSRGKIGGSGKSKSGRMAGGNKGPHGYS